jgi:hypothetical protein
MAAPSPLFSSGFQVLYHVSFAAWNWPIACNHRMYALQRKSYLCIPFLGIARGHIHVSVTFVNALISEQICTGTVFYSFHTKKNNIVHKSIYGGRFLVDADQAKNETYGSIKISFAAFSCDSSLN